MTLKKSKNEGKIHFLIGKMIPFGSHGPDCFRLLGVLFETFFSEPLRGHPLVAIWLILDALWAPFGPFWAPFGLHFDRFGDTFGPFGHFSETLWAPFWHPSGSVLFFFISLSDPPFTPSWTIEFFAIILSITIVPSTFGQIITRPPKHQVPKNGSAELPKG